MLRDSDAVLAIYAGLGWPWRSTSILRAIPRYVRDPLYRLFARDRYRIFGQRQVCCGCHPKTRAG
nr:DCC1-like thiol-disulfide oxidoreductase family protein [Sphingomonas bacterium]